MPCAPSFCKARRLARKPAESSSWRSGVVYLSYSHYVGSAGPKAVSESESGAVFQGFMYHRQPLCHGLQIALTVDTPVAASLAELLLFQVRSTPRTNQADASRPERILILTDCSSGNLDHHPGIAVSAGHRG